MVLAQRQKYRSMEQNRKPRDKSTHLWTPYLFFFRQISVTALFYLEDSRRVRERERERKERTHAGESVRKRFGSSFYMFFPPPGPALCKLGLAGSAVCSA